MINFNLHADLAIATQAVSDTGCVLFLQIPQLFNNSMEKLSISISVTSHKFPRTAGLVNINHLPALRSSRQIPSESKCPKGFKKPLLQPNNKETGQFLRLEKSR